MDRDSIDAGMAADFLRKLGRHLDYNINIIDRNGVIIASRDSSRIGTFHESAFRLLETGADIERVGPDEPLPPGVRPGVNLPIEFHGRTLGVVGVTGDPREVLPVAYAVKTSVESMVELEAYKDKALQRLDKKNLFINYLLHDDDAPRAAIESLAAKLGYAPHAPRAPVLFRPATGLSSGEVLEVVKSCALHRTEDLSWATPEGAVLVFKTIDFADGGVIADYEAAVEGYVTAAAAGFRSRSLSGRPFQAYAGALQTDFARYRGAYRQVLWLADRLGASEDRVAFFYRYLGDFLWSRVPRSDLVDAFDSLAGLLSADYAAELRGTVEALAESAFNGKEAAARLGIHRNTLTARLARLQSVFGVDLRGDPRAREFLSLLSKYLESPNS
jgi:carbohydrate diacid regulator